MLILPRKHNQNSYNRWIIPVTHAKFVIVYEAQEKGSIMSNLSSDSRFRGISLPEIGGIVVGYAKLIDDYNLSVPLPDKLSYISQRHRRYETEGWSIYTPRHEPKDNLSGHLTFALKYEGVRIPIIKELFTIINPEIIARWMRNEPTGRYSRRIWFLYETLTGKMLDIPDVIIGNYVDLADSKCQLVSDDSIPSRRHRVYNNLPELGMHNQSLHRRKGRDQALHQYNEVKTAIKRHFDLSEEEVHTIIQQLSKRDGR
jgi:hypothetical protein